MLILWSFKLIETQLAARLIQNPPYGTSTELGIMILIV